MTVYPYVPPAREYADTILAFKDFQQASTWSVLVENDPLGPVNKIVTLMCGQRRVKSVLWPVPASADVQLVYDRGTGWNAWDGPGWRALNGYPDPDPEPYREACWYVEVNDRRVLEVPEYETYPPRTPPPPVPWYRRTYRALKHALAQQVRADLDKLAGRLGYHRDDECGGYW